MSSRPRGDACRRAPIGPLHPLSTAHPQQPPGLRGDDRWPSACRAVGREFLHQAVGAAEPPPDLAGASVGALGATFELGLIRQAMAEPAAETRPVQDATATSAS